MQIVITWDWFSFIMGVLATLGFGFWSIVFIAVKQYRKQKRAKVETLDSVEKLFAAWGGRDNSSTK